MIMSLGNAYFQSMTWAQAKVQLRSSQMVLKLHKRVGASIETLSRQTQEESVLKDPFSAETTQNRSTAVPLVELKVTEH